MLMDTDGIREHLPHRYPFLLVDRVVELVPGESIVAYKNLSINEEFFQGHFPGKPVFPGVLILEAMAQAAGILGFKSQDKTPADGSIYYFVGADDLRFKRPCIPGDRVYLHAKVLGDRRGIWKFAILADTMVVGDYQIESKLTGQSGRALINSARAGISFLQGPHQVAQKTSTTGLPRCSLRVHVFPLIVSTLKSVSGGKSISHCSSGVGLAIPTFLVSGRMRR